MIRKRTVESGKEVEVLERERLQERREEALQFFLQRRKAVRLGYICPRVRRQRPRRERRRSTFKGTVKKLEHAVGLLYHRLQDEVCGTVSEPHKVC